MRTFEPLTAKDIPALKRLIILVDKDKKTDTRFVARIGLLFVAKFVKLLVEGMEKDRDEKAKKLYTSSTKEWNLRH